MSLIPWIMDYDPGDALSELERAIVAAAFVQVPTLKSSVNEELSVVHRNYTVHGLYTDFRPQNSAGYPERAVLEPLDIFVDSESIEHGACAAVYYIDDCLLGLELASYGGNVALPVTSFSIVWQSKPAEISS
ncbi:MULTISPECIES: hypothetical protein [Leisingera]|jgi:hypothetical protein|uniref:Uncharacterized protein n=1 Tax=Leisingera aquaemixtae TaxID=1396826 RepID=A0ABY5WFV5_9RHOB|nr:MULTISPECIES: hypothetical protein [Leisingera]QDI75176.1 hypothetical protein R2C4_05200 [Leisingera aquaemixtae]UWQ40349.1 hypothetical protein K3718_12350 [Leisingera aquaemixtae]